MIRRWRSFLERVRSWTYSALRAPRKRPVPPKIAARKKIGYLELGVWEDSSLTLEERYFPDSLAWTREFEQYAYQWKARRSIFDLLSEVSCGPARPYAIVGGIAFLSLAMAALFELRWLVVTALSIALLYQLHATYKPRLTTRLRVLAILVTALLILEIGLGLALRMLA